MKNFAIAALLVVGAASPALAGTVDILSSPYQSGSGGEFTFISRTAGFLDPVNYNAATSTRNVGEVGSFQTFCIETDEFISIPDTGYTATLSNTAIAGGSGGPDPDPLSVGTGWLYSQFAQGTLSGYNYGAGRTTSAALLQQAIWWLEEENGHNYNAGNAFMVAVITQFGSEALARADGAQNYGVMAINMTKNGNKKQDGLFYASVPDGGATLMLLGGAMMGLGIIRRKFSL